MNKKGKLSTAEKFYIEQNVGEKDVKTVAKDLNRSESVVQKYWVGYQKLSTKAGGHFARQSGATVMTPTASILADETRTKKRPTAAISDCITTIKKHEDVNDTV